MIKIRLVCATPATEHDFYQEKILGRSLSLYQELAHEFEIRLFPENRRGLSTVYNEAIAESANESRLLVFVHDDIHFFDLFWPMRLREALARFHLVGLLGCKRHYKNQISWVHYLRDDGQVGNPRRTDLSGTVAHYARETSPIEFDQLPIEPRKAYVAPFGEPMQLSYFGPPDQPVIFLDGMLLACYSDTLLKNNIRFDEQFEFHFYDMDFCRQFEQKKLTMGTCSLSLLHGSHGSYNEVFMATYPKYVTKWAGVPTGNPAAA